ncbi:MAG: hypothetical protein WBP79_15495 [Candidatus Acidiferrales bacterium]
MPIRFHTATLLFLALVGIVGLTACGGGGSSTSTVTSVSLSPASASVPINGQFEFTATVNLSSTTITTSTAVTFEVNGTAGGNSTLGTIVPDPTDIQRGIYTAPGAVPAVNNGQVSITAVAPQDPSSTTNTATVTSTASIVTIGVGQGLQVSPSVKIVPAGGQVTFAATFNGLPDASVIWTVSSANGGNVGTIDAHSGLFTAPPFPPPGASVTITATDGPNVGLATAQIVYSDASLQGPFAFSYTGNDAGGFQAVSGSFVSDGAGHIVSGVEDIESLATGVSTHVQISGTYLVKTDGRTTAMINPGLQTTATWQFALTTNQHAVLIRFDRNSTGSGVIDQQDLSDLTNSPSVISGPYVFKASGADTNFKPLAIAGKFVADSPGGISPTDTILDVNENGVTTTEDRTLHGSYEFDSLFPDTGRGTLTLTSTATGQRQYAFYLVDKSRLHFVEIDRNAFLAGDLSSAPAGNSFTTSSLASGNYAFTLGGASSSAAYAQGGVFSSSGSGMISGGAVDTNNGGTVQLNSAVSSCAYSVDNATGRIDLVLGLGGTCTPGPTAGEFAAYPTADGRLFMLELASGPITTGVAYPQQTIAALLPGSFSANIAGQGIFHNSPASYQQDIEGEFTVSGADVTAGNLDIDNFNAAIQSDPLEPSANPLSAPAANGRGTVQINVTNPTAVYNLVYYLIDANRALLFDQDTTTITIGIVERQF